MSAQLRLSNLPTSSFPSKRRLFPSNLLNPSISIPPIRSSRPNLSVSGGSGGGSGGRRGGSGGSGDDNDQNPDPVGPAGFLLKGWNDRVSADPQFPFKVLMEEIVGVSACVLGDMATRANFGLNELDFVFCTLVVGSIVNFVLMYLLAPTAVSSAASSSSLPSYIFAPGNFSLASRIGTFAYKGVTFAAVGFAAGMLGTAISNGLMSVRKRMDPEFETPNKAPPTVLNAVTWAAHMGLSSNVRYQTLNGVEFVMEKGLPPLGFKVLVVVMRCLNNVLGGMSFVMLARLTGSQKAGLSGEGSAAVVEEEGDGNGE